MAPRKAKSTTTIDPITLCSAALKSIKIASDFHRIGSTTEQSVFQTAWEQLPNSEQQRITEIVSANTLPTPEAIASELTACGNYIELKGIKAEYGEVAIKAAWTLLPQGERDRLKAICANVNQPVESQAVEASEPQPVPQPTKKPTLIELTAELQKLDSFLDTIDGDIPVELQQAVDELLAQRETTQEAVLEKLDNYAALIQSRVYWAATRKAEAERLAKLAETDARLIDFLKGRLKAYLEATEQNQLRTKRFNLSVCQNGGKAPLRFDNTLPEQMPERFQRVTIEPDKEAIRMALEAGEELGFAYLAALMTS